VSNLMAAVLSVSESGPAVDEPADGAEGAEIAADVPSSNIEAGRVDVGDCSIKWVRRRTSMHASSVCSSNGSRFCLYMNSISYVR
jgi:hypothetical protein